MASPYDSVQWGQLPANAGTAGYDYALNPSNFGAPAAGTAFGRQRPQFPQSAYAYMNGSAQPYTPTGTFGAPAPDAFRLPSIPGLGPMGNMLYQGLGTAVVQQLTGRKELTGPMNEYNVVQGVMGSIYQKDVMQAMGFDAPIRPEEQEAYNARSVEINALEEGLKLAEDMPSEEFENDDAYVTQLKENRQTLQAAQTDIDDRKGRRDTTEGNLKNAFQSIALATHGGVEGLRRESEVDIRKEFSKKGDEGNEEYRQLSRDIKQLREQETKLKEAVEPPEDRDALMEKITTDIKAKQEVQSNLISPAVESRAKQREATTIARAEEAAKKFSDVIYDPGPEGALARNALMALGNTAIGEGVQQATPELFLAPGMMAAGRALSASPFGITGKEGANLTQEIAAMMKGDKEAGFDPAITRGLKPSELGDLTYQLSRRGLITGDYSQGDDTDQQKTRVDAVKRAMGKYTPLIDDLGELFKKDRGDVDKLITNLEGMTAGMTQMLSADRLQGIVRQARETSMLTGISEEQVAELIGITEAESRSRGYAPGIGVKAANMALRYGEDVRQTRMAFGKGESTYIGRRSTDQLTEAATVLAMRGVTSQTANVIGGTLEALDTAGWSQGIHDEDFKKMSPTEKAKAVISARREKGEIVEEKDEKNILEFIQAVESGDNTKLVHDKSEDREGMVGLISRSFGGGRQEAISNLYNMTTRTQLYASEHMETIQGVQAEEAIKKISDYSMGNYRKFAAEASTGYERYDEVVGKDTEGFSQAFTRAALVGDDASVKGQMARAKAFLVEKGFTPDEAQEMAKPMLNQMYVQSQTGEWTSLGGDDKNARGLSAALSEILDPTKKALSDARKAGVTAVMNMDEQVREAGLGQDTAAQRFVHSLMTSDDKKIKATFDDILFGVPKEKRDAIENTLKDVRTQFTAMETSIRTGKPEDAKGAVTKFEEDMASNADELQEFFDIAKTPENIEKITAAMGEDDVVADGEAVAEAAGGSAGITFPDVIRVTDISGDFIANIKLKSEDSDDK